MTLQQARDILKSPKWGDPQALLAKAIVHDDVAAEKIRVRLIGRTIGCPLCGCRCTSPCTCKLCGGTGSVTIDRKLANGWDHDACLSVLEEYGDD